MLSMSTAWCHPTTAGKETSEPRPRPTGLAVGLTPHFPPPPSLQPPAPAPPPALPLLRAKGPR